MKLRQTISAVAVGLTTACSSGPAGLPAPVDHDAQGSWGQDVHGAIIPGNSFTMELTESSGMIIGFGSFAGEVGPYGALHITGVVAKDSMDLQVVYAYQPTVFPKLRPDTAQFAGVLTDKNHVTGELTRGGTTQRFDLIRLTNGDRP